VEGGGGRVERKRGYTRTSRKEGAVLTENGKEAGKTLTACETTGGDQAEIYSLRGGLTKGSAVCFGGAKVQ